MLEDGVGSWGSRSAIVGGAAVVAAAQLKARVEGRKRSYTIEGLLEVNYNEEVFDRHTLQLNTFGANLSTVSIDTYGAVSVKECAAYYDVGRALSPNVIKGQIFGGSIQGIGQALYESVMNDSEGRLLTKDLFDAGVLIAENIQEFFITIVEHPSSFAHHAKGLGEAPTIGVPVAVIRAIKKVSVKRIRRTLSDPKNSSKTRTPDVPL